MAGGATTQHQKASRYDTGKTYDSGFKYDSYTAHKPRRIVFKVYNNSDTFIGVLDDVVSDIQIVKNINGGLEPMTIRTSKPIDNFSQGSLINHGNIVRIYLTDHKNTDQIIYTGYISSYEPFLGAEGEGTDIQLLPNIAQLSEDFFRTGTNLEITKSSMEISLVVQDIIEKYQEKVTTALVTYPPSIRKNTGNTISYQFKAKKTIQAIKKCAEFLDSDWYWYVQPDGQLKIDQQSSTADITLTIGKNIKSIRTRKTVERVINKVIFWNGKEENDPLYIYKDYNDASSQSSYGIRSKFIKDGRVTVQATADLFANRIIQKYKDPKTIVQVEVTQNGINLATIEPGQTVNIRNIDTTNQTTFPDGLVIAKVSFTLDSAILELSEKLPDIAVDVEEEQALQFDRLVQDIQDRINAIPNTQLNIRVRANTAIVNPDGGEQFTDVRDAIEYIDDLGGGVILLREGVHDLSSQSPDGNLNFRIKDNIILKGEGTAKTIITGRQIVDGGDSGLYNTGTVDVENGSKVVTGNSTAWVTAGVRPGHPFYKTSDRRDYIIASVDSETQITLETAYQEATDTGMSYSILRDTQNFAILDIQFQGLNARISFGHIRNFLLNNIFVSGTSGTGCSIDFADIFEVSNSRFENCGQSAVNTDGLEILQSSGSVAGVAVIRNNQCLNNKEAGGNQGIDCNRPHTKIIDNICRDNDSNGIRLGASADNCIVQGNICEDNVVYGINIVSGSDNNIVTGNQATGNTTGSILDNGTGNVVADNKT